MRDAIQTDRPRRLRYGVATSALQIEGALDADGRGRSVWEDFCDEPGRVERGENAAVACEHYARWETDLNLLSWLGVDAYRFSIAWPRVVPEGTGRVEPRGLDFYERLVDGLLARGIEPVPTLFHWELPVPLWRKYGGWLGRETAQAFSDYAAAVFARLGDRVGTWMVLNEPFTIHATGSYQIGVHAPGHKGTFADRLLAGHHQLLGLGLVRQLHAQGGWKGTVGFGEAFSPHRRLPGINEELAEEAREFDFFWYSHVLHTGRYPLIDRRPDLAALLPKGYEEDCELVGRWRTDFLGINYYTPRWIEPAEGNPLGWKPGAPPENEVRGRNSLGWPIDPGGLGEVLRTIHARYPDLPLLISENGLCDEIGPPADGSPAIDEARCRFLDDHLAVLDSARAEGIPVSHYFHWSLMDNFEWAKGYRPRFGLVSVDYATQERRPKRSAHRFREIIAKSREP